MELDEYIEKMKDIQNYVLSFIDSDDCSTLMKDDLFKFFDEKHILEDKSNMKPLLKLFVKILNNYHHFPYFFKKIEIILSYFKESMKQNLSNKEIFHIFRKHNRIILFLIQEKILEIDKNLVQQMVDYNEHYLKYFFPEIKSFIDDETILQQFESEIPEDFEKKRENFDNENYLYQLIQNDSIDDFVIYMNRTNTSVNSKIIPSIFETNQFIIKNNLSLIEYAAFYGSIQIFQYLKYNGAILFPNLWISSIHGANPEIIHILEEYNFQQKISYQEYYNEAIKCHHNNIAVYLKGNLMDENNINENSISENIFKSRNYTFFPMNYNDKQIAKFLCKYNYVKLVKILLETKKLDKDILINEIFYEKSIYSSFQKYNDYENLRCAVWNNKVEIVEFLLSQPEIPFGVYFFYDCHSLKRISLSSTITSIKLKAFYNCSLLTEVIIPSSVTIIRESAFEYCTSLKCITIPSSVIELGECIFKNCISLEDIELPESIQEIPSFMFFSCSSLKKILIPSSVLGINWMAFGNCTSLTEIIFKEPSSLKIIGPESFIGCSLLSKLSIPLSVSTICESAFQSCSSLKSIDIPSVVYIYESAFQRCSSLTQVVLNTNSSIQMICNSSFYDCSMLTKMTIPSSVTRIDDFAFGKCSSLINIIIPSSVTIIGDYSFIECSSLTRISIPSSVMSIGDGCFEKCVSIQQVTFEAPSKITEINDNTFNGCLSLKEIEIPPLVTRINFSAFYKCISLNNVTFPSSLKEIGDLSFRECVSLSQICIPPSVNKIKQQAFRGCISLTCVSVPSLCGEIEYRAFEGCSHLREVVISSPYVSADTCRAWP